jgi:hypothetical protein
VNARERHSSAGHPRKDAAVPMILVNLTVKDLPASKRFFGELG